MGLIDVTVTFLPLVKRAKGRIVNIASVAGRTHINDLTPYCISKYGVEVFSDGLRFVFELFRMSDISIQTEMFVFSDVHHENLCNYPL